MRTEKRLSKALSAAGVASRRACEKLIFSGRVKVNGKTTLLPQTIVSWERDEIVVDGRKIQGEEKKRYYILNKPRGCVCSSRKASGERIVLDLFEKLGKEVRLFTVGRLDRDTTGLIIVTNDGLFANKVIHPSSNVKKEYLAKTSQEITAMHLMAVLKGTWVEGSFVKPVSVKKVRKGTLKVVVKEGKKHEVRELLANAGLKVLELSRIRIGRLILGSLRPGRWREMTESERRMAVE